MCVGGGGGGGVGVVKGGGCKVDSGRTCPGSTVTFPFIAYVQNFFSILQKEELGSEEEQQKLWILKTV